MADETNNDLTTEQMATKGLEREPTRFRTLGARID